MNAPLEVGLQPYVLSETKDGVATLTLNRGERFNPLSLAMIDALYAELERIERDSTVRVVVIAATGRAFCAGHDLKEMRAHIDAGWQRSLFSACTRMMLKLVEIPQPVIARVHASAAAAGCQLVSMCDLAVAAESAMFGLSGVKAGIFCSTPAVGVFRNVGRKRSMELLVTGEMIDANIALAWGLVNRVVTAQGLDDAVNEFTRAICAKSPAVISLGKRAFYKQIESSLSEAYDIAGEVMTCNMLDPDASEGIDAFLGKRPPKWGG